MSVRKFNNLELLEKCWKNIYSSKKPSKRAKSKGEDGISLEDFKKNEFNYLRQLHEELVKNRYKLKPLHYFLEKKEEKGKYRLILVFNIKDRIIHKMILSIIHPIFYFLIDTKVSYCGVKNNIWGRNDKESLNTKKAFNKILKHVKDNNFFVYKADIKKFYDNVSKRRIIRMLTQRINDPILTKYLKEIVYFKLKNYTLFIDDKAIYMPQKYKGIPQGSSLSQFLANIYLSEFDYKMKEKFGDRFIRYVDDFVVFCSTKEEVKYAEKLSIKLLKQKGLEVSPEKSKTVCLKGKGQYINFLGIRIDSSKLTYKKDLKETGKMIKEILNEKDNYYKGLSLDETIKLMQDRIDGLAEYLKYYHVEDIYSIFNKYIRDKKRKRKFLQLKLLDLKNLQPIITRQDWQILFK